MATFSLNLPILFLIFLVFFLGIRLLRAWIYDFFITSMTKKWYRTVLQRLPEGALLLDVGIGTGTALLKNFDLIQKHKFRIHGIDYDLDYVKKCQKLIQQYNAENILTVEHVSVYDYKGKSEEKFDAAYFSGSLMIMPNPVKALQHVMQLMKDDGRIYCTQTFEGKKNVLMEKVKPLLKFLTTIDFGQVTYEKDFLQTFQTAGLEIEENIAMEGTYRTFRLVVAKPKSAKIS